MVYEAPNEDIELQAPPNGGADTYEAGAEILAGQVVTITGDDTVSPSTTDGEAVKGVATQSVSAGAPVNVVSTGGKVRVTAGAAVSAGDLLASGGGTNDDGTVVTAATGNYTLGMADQGASAGETLTTQVDLAGPEN